MENNKNFGKKVLIKQKIIVQTNIVITEFIQKPTIPLSMPIIYRETEKPTDLIM